MLKLEDQMKKMAMLTGVMLMAAAEAIAQDKSAARRAAWWSVFPTANSRYSKATACRRSSDGGGRARYRPAPRASLDRQQHRRPHLVHQGHDRSSRARQSAGHPLARPEPQRLRHSWHQPPGLHRPQRLARLHPDAQSRSRGALRMVAVGDQSS